MMSTFDSPRFAFGLDLNGVVDVRQVAVGELDVDDRPDDLNDFADFLLRCDSVAISVAILRVFTIGLLSPLTRRTRLR